MRQLTIGRRIITERSLPYIIAELGHNHQGSPEICKKMVYAAKTCGVDAIKLQRINAKELFTKTFYNSPYNSENAFAATYGAHREFLTLPDSVYSEIRDLTHALGMDFICTAFEEQSADFLAPLVDAFKIASFHAKDKPLLDHIKGKGKPIIVSTGYCTMHDVLEVNKNLEGAEYALLHCTSEYPVRNPTHINLGVITQYRALFKDTLIGYSHHYGAPFAAASSVFFGAKIIEAHFTLNRLSKGTDHVFSLDPDGLKWLFNQARFATRIMGNKKEIYPEEEMPIEKMSRSIYPARAIKAGEVLGKGDLRVRAPGRGLRPGTEIEGKISLSDLSTAEAITDKDLE